MPHFKILHIGTNKKFDSTQLSTKTIVVSETHYLEESSLNDLNHYDLLLINSEKTNRSSNELQLLERCDVLSIYYREGLVSKWSDIKTGLIEIVYNNLSEFTNSLTEFINELEYIYHELSQFNHMYRHHPLPLIITDQDFIVRYSNKQANKIFSLKKHHFYVPNIKIFNLISVDSLSSLEFAQAIEINKNIAKKIVTVQNFEQKYNFTLNSWLVHLKTKPFYAFTFEQNNEFSNVYEIDKLNKIISQQDWFQQLSILKQLNDPFLILSADLTMLFSNPSFNLLFSYTNDYSKEIMLHDIFLNDTQLYKTIKHGIDEAKNTKKICNYNEIGFKTTENDHFFDLIFVPNTNQQNANYLVIFRDETIRHTYKKQLEQVSQILIEKKINILIFNDEGLITFTNKYISTQLNLDSKKTIWDNLLNYGLNEKIEILSDLSKYQFYQKQIEVKKNYSISFFNLEISYFLLGQSPYYSINLTPLTENKKTEKTSIQDWLKEFQEPLINLIDDLIFIMDIKGNFKFINKNAEFFFNKNNSSTLNSIYDYLAMPDRQYIDQLIANSKLGKKGSCDVFIKNKENKFRCFSINSAPLFTNQILDAIICTARDIHLQKELELEINRQNEHLEDLVLIRTNELEQSQKHYKTLFNGSGDFIYLLNKDSQLIMINEAGLRILRPNIDSPISQNYKLVFASDYSQYLHYAIENVFFSKAAYSTQHEMAVDNESIFFHTLLSPIFNINNEIIEIVGISRDITEIINLQGLLDSERERILQADKLATIGELATGIAHEINQPLNHIKLALSMNELDLDKGIVKPEKLKEEFALIYQDIDRASNIIKILREFGRNESHHLNSSININDCIRDAAIMFNYSLISANVDYSEQLLATDCYFFGGKNRLEQVIINLVNNARDSLETSIIKKINIRTENKVNSVIINIEDSGKGVPEEIVEKIFNPFFTSKEVGKGTGVGLSISVNIIQSFGGSLTLSKNTSSGATFSIELPIRKDFL